MAADLNHIGADKQSALSLAQQNHNAEIVTMLKAAGAQ